MFYYLLVGFKLRQLRIILIDNVFVSKVTSRWFYTRVVWIRFYNKGRNLKIWKESGVCIKMVDSLKTWDFV